MVAIHVRFSPYLQDGKKKMQFEETFLGALDFKHNLEMIQKNEKQKKYRDIHK